MKLTASLLTTFYLIRTKSATSSSSEYLLEGITGRPKAQIPPFLLKLCVPILALERKKVIAYIYQAVLTEFSEFKRTIFWSRVSVS